jgi:hypothetical protein
MSIKDTAIRNLNERLKWVEQAQKAVELVDLLPPEILALEGSADCNGSNNDLSININTYLNKGIDLLKVCKMAGVQGLVLHMSYNNPDSWYADGTIAIGDSTATINLHGMPRPPTCRIESTTETKEVTIYKAICKETGEEIS